MNKLNNFLFGTTNVIKNNINTPYSFNLDTILEFKNDEQLKFNQSKRNLQNRLNNNNIKIMGFFNYNIDTNFYFDHWQYIDQFVYQKYSDNQTTITPPPSNLIYTAHNNGVKIYGYIKFDSLKSLNIFLSRKNEQFIYADKLIDLVKYICFDGWTIDCTNIKGNTETSIFITEFFKYIKKISNMEIIFIDSLIKDGSLNPQNQLNENNLCFYHQDTVVSDYFILNTEWINLNNTIKQSEKINRNPNNIYASVLCDHNLSNKLRTIYNTNKISISLKLANNMTDELWTAFDKYNIYNTTITELPFITNFNCGYGNKYFINGSCMYNKKWSNINQQDILPTWKNKFIKHKSSYVTINNYLNDAYNGGSCLRFDGLIKPNEFVDVNLYKTNINIEKNTKIIHIYTKRLVNFIKASLIIHFTNNKHITLTLSDDVLYNTWIINKYKIMLTNKIIDYIALRFENNTDNEISMSLLLGGISIFKDNNEKPKCPNELIISNLVTEKNFSNSKKQYIRDKSNFCISWNNDDSIWYYEIFRCIISENQNNIEYIGRSYNNIFYINDLIREEDELYSIISVKSVNYNQIVSINEATIKV
jgi:endo-beta-N-acetylglucosaminidase D